MTEINVLVIEEDEALGRRIERSLRGDEFNVTVANNGVDGLIIARKIIPGLVILDGIMPGMDGDTVRRKMRKDPILRDIPILFLTAKVKEEDKIAGFNAGADDFLSKPFNIHELILRVRAILRRTRNKLKTGELQPAEGLTRGDQAIDQQTPHETQAVETPQCLIVGDYLLDPLAFELHVPKRGKLRLTPVQYDLLYHLMSHPGQIFSPARLLDEVWDYPADSGSPDLVRVHIKNLRERIEDDPSTPKFIRTVPGYGYTINPAT